MTYRTIDKRRWDKPKEITGLPVADAKAALAAAEAPNETLADDLSDFEPLKEAEEESFSLKPIAQVWGEFKIRHADNAESTQWLNQFKAVLPKFPGVSRATLLTLNNEVVATYRYDGVLSEKRVKDNYPDLYQRFLRRKSVLVFDKDAFQAEYPLEFQLCRGRSLRLKKSAGGILLTGN